MNTTCIKIDEMRVSLINEYWTDKTDVLSLRFEIPGIKKDQVQVTFDTLEGILKIGAYSYDKCYNFEKDVFKILGENSSYKRWNGEANLMPLELQDGILTIRIECGLWQVQRGVF